MNLVIHHMLEPLVVGGAQEDLGVHLPPRVAGVHHLVYDVNFKAIQCWRYELFKVKICHLIPVLLVSVLDQQFGDFSDVHSVIEWRGVTNLTLVATHLKFQFNMHGILNNPNKSSGI